MSNKKDESKESKSINLSESMTARRNDSLAAQKLAKGLTPTPGRGNPKPPNEVGPPPKPPEKKEVE